AVGVDREYPVGSVAWNQLRRARLLSGVERRDREWRCAFSQLSGSIHQCPDARGSVAATGEEPTRVATEANAGYLGGVLHGLSNAAEQPERAAEHEIRRVVALRALLAGEVEQLYRGRDLVAQERLPALLGGAGALELGA